MTFAGLRTRWRLAVVSVAVPLARGSLPAPATARATARPIGLGAIGRVVAHHEVKETRVPLASKPQVGNAPRTARVLPKPGGQVGWSGNRSAPVMRSREAQPSLPGTTSRTPRLSSSFKGMSDSPTICPPGGCAPPDGALAASPQFVMEGVNSSFAVYSTAGAPSPGWPKTAGAFFGVPAPSPTGCDGGNGPYLFDPRAFYDPNADRFWVSMGETEGTPTSTPSCAFSSSLWLAVSATADPQGVWNVYQIDLSNGSGLWGDFPQIGFDGEATFFSANMFDASGNFQYAEIGEANKAAMESSGSFVPYLFTNLEVGG